MLNFKYQGGTASITYEHIWSPLAEYLLKFVPTWVAPNLITFVAFVIVVVSHLIFMYVGDSSFQAPVPVWKYILMGITISLYQNLDNMDGKQARRTSNDKFKFRNIKSNRNVIRPRSRRTHRSLVWPSISKGFCCKKLRYLHFNAFWIHSLP